MATQTALRLLANERLAGNLDGLVEGLRLGGWSWRRISREIKARSGLEISHESLRGWYGTTERGAA